MTRKAFSTAAQGPGQIALDARFGLIARPAPKEHHDDERGVAPKKKVHQEMLVHPVDLT
jgi:hypothetical protein